MDRKYDLSLLSKPIMTFHSSLTLGLTWTSVEPNALKRIFSSYVRVWYNTTEGQEPCSGAQQDQPARLRAFTTNSPWSPLPLLIVHYYIIHHFVFRFPIDFLSDLLSWVIKRKLSNKSTSALPQWTIFSLGGGKKEPGSEIFHLINSIIRWRRGWL